MPAEEERARAAEARSWRGLPARLALARPIAADGQRQRSAEAEQEQGPTAPNQAHHQAPVAARAGIEPEAGDQDSIEKRGGVRATAARFGQSAAERRAVEV